VIIRVEIPGTRKEDIDISIHGNLLRIRGEKRSEGEHQDRLYRLTERAYGHFERTITIPHDIDDERAEVSYRDGVITVILPKTITTPPRQLTIP
jgi:HSP20 family protein